MYSQRIKYLSHFIRWKLKICGTLYDRSETKGMCQEFRSFCEVFVKSEDNVWLPDAWLWSSLCILLITVLKWDARIVNTYSTWYLLGTLLMRNVLSRVFPSFFLFFWSRLARHDPSFTVSGCVMAEQTLSKIYGSLFLNKLNKYGEF